MSNKLEGLLPSWASLNAAGVVVIDPDAAYPALSEKVLQELGQEAPDRYSMEVVAQFAKLHVQMAATASTDDPRREGKSLKIMIRGDAGRSERWRRDSFPAGRDPLLATKGRGARALFKKTYKVLPS